MEILLRWWLIFCLTILGVLASIHFDLHLLLNEADKIGFLILGMTGLSTIWIGRRTYFCIQKGRKLKPLETEWFIAESCLTLGMVGTVIGFILMLGTTFSAIDVTDLRTLQLAIEGMASGMSTALYTTLVGLISSLVLKVQLINLENFHNYEEH